jgi:hypothetical protein
MKNTMLDTVLSYAAKGYLVFPCRPKSKEPATKHGFKDATTDEETVRGWWSDNPNYNVAIRTGKESGLVVLDVDEGGEDSLYDNIWHVPPTVIAKTTKGFHAYLRHPGFDVKNKVRFAPGLDVKADGGYVIAPPSVHPSGDKYEWETSFDDAEVEECPDWLVGKREGETLSFLNLGETMRREIEPPNQLIEQLLYEQAIVSLYAPGGSGKTIMALWIAMLVMEQSLNVVYVDEENGQLRIAERLQQLGADPDTVAKHFLYADGPGLTLASLHVWEATMEQVKPALVIFDPFADLLAMSNLEENSAGDVTKWIKAFAQPVKEAGGAVLILDHVMKDDGGKYARGSSAKHAKVDAAWKLKVEDEFDRNTVGEVSIKRDKDRLGCMPEKRKFAVGGDGTGNRKFKPGEVIESIGPRADGLKPSEYKVLSVLEKLPGMTRKQWEQQCANKGIPTGTFKPAVSKLKTRHVFEDKDKRWWPRSGEETVTGYGRDNHDEAIPIKQSA